MKKTLIAMAVLAAAGAASAQSSVTLFGILDATLQYGSGNLSNKTQLGNSGYSSSQVGFRGTEDLGGGMLAKFWFEAGMNNDNGSGANTNTNNQSTGQPGAGTVPTGSQGLTFNRRSTVGLAGGWGEIRLGRDYSPQFRNLTVFDPFGTNGVGTSQMLNSIITGFTAVRASNSLGYLFNTGDSGFAGARPGFYAQAMYYMGENANSAVNSSDGRGAGLRVGYSAGPLNVALAFSQTTYTAGDVKQNNIGGSYDFGGPQLLGQYSWDTNGIMDGRAYLIGGLIPMGQGTVRLAYSHYRTNLGVAGVADPTTGKWALGYAYALSKRTVLYTTYAHTNNSNGAASVLNGSTGAANGSSSGMDFGIRHAF